jgi:hypothetical protein
MDKVIVAIHGIGSQRRSDTIRSVARRFGARSKPPLPVMPLGFFHLGKAGEVHVSRLDTTPADPLARIGFAEVFWADIPREVVKEDDTLEETKAWGSSVVSRAHATYLSTVEHRLLTPEDFQLGAGVVEEIVETVSVMENLLAVAEKAGVFKFELAPLLRDYSGDVQIVTEFKFYRDKIVYRFHNAMAQIFERLKEMYPGRTPEIYVVAHSEGTVVSFLGLLQALSVASVSDPDMPSTMLDTGWIRFVRGFMTIGSPIDKHLVLWPKLWDGLNLGRRTHVAGPGDGVAHHTLERPIKWRNYYDFGDPIGFKLETAVRFLQLRNCDAFEFETSKHDFGFSRYWLPGKAHNDYWGDPEVFGHFIDDVVFPVAQPEKPVPPKSRVLTGIVSTAVPYALTILLHLAAVFVLYKAVTAFLAPGEAPARVQQLSLQISLLSLLLISVTVAARLPRLVKPVGLRWHGLALLAFLAGAVPCALFLPQGVADFLGGPLTFLVRGANLPPAQAGKAALLLVAALVAATGWWVPRQPRFGRRALIILGSTAVFIMVVSRLVEDHADAPVWPVVLAGLAFLYLWWLGILLFDLAFIWHRYIRNSVAVDTLGEWQRGRDAWPKVTMRRKPADRG